MRLEDGVNVAGPPPCVVGERHCGAADDVDVRDDATAHEAVPEAPECILDSGAIEQRIGVGHATSSSCGAT